MESRSAVVVAVFSNAAIAVAKFVASALTGSSAMFSEGVHSTVDTVDELLLLYGQHRSRRPADDQHPFGHGQELYFWALVVSIMIFGVGGGVGFYEGLLRTLQGGGRLESASWNYAVLGVSAVLEGSSWMVGMRKLAQARRGRSFWRTFRESKDPALLTVVVEDSAALLGLLLAWLGVLGSHLLRIPAVDAIASMCIGILLAGVALLLARESRSLLVGESAGNSVVRRMREGIARLPPVASVGGIWTMQLGPEDVLVACEVEFRRDRAGAVLNEAIGSVEETIRAVEPGARRIFVEARWLTTGLQADGRSPRA